MSFEKFFQIIDSTRIGDFIARKQAIIENTDPEHIYVENIRGFFGVPHRVAASFCAMAVKRGLFEHRFGVLCPKHRQIVAERGEDENFEPVVTCNICQGLGEEEFQYEPRELGSIEFFRLRETCSTSGND